MKKIIRTDSENPSFRALVAKLDGDLATKNGDKNDFFAQFNHIDLIQHVVVAIDLADIPVACGAFKPMDAQTVEIKRMYTEENARNKGLATSILQALETWAAECGYTRCVLETGSFMQDAVGLYQKNGYQIIPNYGPYVDEPSSVCFEKILKIEN